MQTNLIEYYLTLNNEIISVNAKFNNQSIQYEYTFAEYFQNYLNNIEANKERLSDFVSDLLFNKDEIKAFIKNGDIIKINSNSNILHNLPFELAKLNNSYLHNKNIKLIRDTLEHKNILPHSGTLKILIIISYPLDSFKNAPLDLLEEVKEIYNALNSYLKEYKIELFIEEKANKQNIQKVINANQFDIIHFSGHGIRGGELLIEDNSSYEKSTTLTAKEFIELFSYQPKLFIFDACETALSSDKDSFALQVYRAFDSVVIGNIESVYDSEAIKNLKAFYSNLFNSDIQDYFSEVRATLGKDWYKAVIFSPIFDTKLFNLTKRESQNQKRFNITNIDSIVKRYVYRYELIRKSASLIEQNNIIGFYGIGGTGKTYLMQYFAWFYQGRFDNVIYIDFREKEIFNIKSLLNALLKELYTLKIVSKNEYKELKNEIDSEEEFFATEALKEKLDTLKNTLLIFDNIETMQNGSKIEPNLKDLISLSSIKVFLASRVKIELQTGIFLENFIIVKDFSHSEYILFLQKANNKKLLIDIYETLQKHYSLHPLFINLIDDFGSLSKELIFHSSIKQRFEFYRKLLDNSILLFIPIEVSNNFLKALNIDITLLEELKSKYFIFKNRLYPLLRAYLKKDATFNLDIKTIEALPEENLNDKKVKKLFKLIYYSKNKKAKYLKILDLDFLDTSEYIEGYLENLDNFDKANVLFNLAQIKTNIQEKQNLLNEAIKNYNKAIELNPYYFEAFNNKALALSDLAGRETNIQEKQNLLNEAIKNLNRAIKLNPNCYLAFNNKASALKNLAQIKTNIQEKQNLLNEAIKNYNKAIELNPYYFEAFNNKALALSDLAGRETNIQEKQNLLNEAIKNLNRAIKLNPNYFEAFNNKANALKNLAQIETNIQEKQNLLNEAIKNYNKATKLNPNYSSAFNNIANALSNLAGRETNIQEKQNLLNEAIKNLNRAIKLNPNIPQVFNNKANALSDLAKIETNIQEKQNLLNEAIKNYKKAIELNPNFSEAFNNKANALRNLAEIETNIQEKQNLLNEAIKNYNKATKLNPNCYLAFNNKALALSDLAGRETNIQEKQNLLNEAIKNLNRAIKLNPNAILAFNNKANALSDLAKIETNIQEKQNLLNEAIKNYKKAIELNPNYSLAFNNKAIALSDLAQIENNIQEKQTLLEKAIENYDKAIELNPNYSLAFNNKAIALKNLAQIETNIQEKQNLLNEVIESYNSAFEISKNIIYLIKKLIVELLVNNNFYKDFCYFAHLIDYQFEDEARYLLNTIIDNNLELLEPNSLDNFIKNEHRCFNFYKIFYKAYKEQKEPDSLI